MGIDLEWSELNPHMPNNVQGELIRDTYLKVIPQVRAVLKDMGYAVAVHGSLTRDCDLVVVPWVENHATRLEVVARLLEELPDSPIDANYFRHMAATPHYKPHGRICHSIHIGWHLYLDLSFTPSCTLP